MKDKTKYINYINSQEWRNKREEVFKVKGYKCEACGIDNGLHVHHGTYRRIYKEKISDLFVLCSYCHMSLHDKYGTKDLLRATKSFIKGEELIPRRRKISKRLSRTERNRIRKEKALLVPHEIRIIKMFCVTNCQMLTGRTFNYKKYLRFNSKRKK